MKKIASRLLLRQFCEDMARISVQFNITSSARQHQAADNGAGIGAGQSLSKLYHGKDPGTPILMRLVHRYKVSNV